MINEKIKEQGYYDLINTLSDQDINVISIMDLKEIGAYYVCKVESHNISAKMKFEVKDKTSGHIDYYFLVGANSDIPNEQLISVDSDDVIHLTKSDISKINRLYGY